MRRVSCESTSRTSTSRVSPECPFDRGPGDLVEDHAPHGHLGAQLLEEVPRDRLSLAVLVRREQQLVGVLQLSLEVGDDALLVRVDDVVRLEALIDRDTQGAVLGALLLWDLGGAFGQVADVPDARLDHEVRTEIAGDRPRLRRRLDDHERAFSVCFCGHLGSLRPAGRSRHVSAMGRGRRVARAFATPSAQGRYRLGTCRPRCTTSPPRSAGLFSTVCTGSTRPASRTCRRAAPSWPPTTRPTSTPGRSAFHSGPGSSSTSWPSRSSSTRRWRRSSAPAAPSRCGVVSRTSRRSRPRSSCARAGRSSPCFPRERGGRRVCERSSLRGRTWARHASRSRPACRWCRQPSAAPTACSGCHALAVAYGPAIPVDDLDGLPPKDAVETATQRLMTEIEALYESL